MLIPGAHKHYDSVRCPLGTAVIVIHRGRVLGIHVFHDREVETSQLLLITNTFREPRMRHQNCIDDSRLKSGPPLDGDIWKSKEISLVMRNRKGEQLPQRGVLPHLSLFPEDIPGKDAISYT